MTSVDDQTAATLATVARFSAALERRDVDGLIAEMTDDVVLEDPGSAPDGERCVVRWIYHGGGGPRARRGPAAAARRTHLRDARVGEGVSGR